MLQEAPGESSMLPRTSPALKPKLLLNSRGGGDEAGQ